MIEDALDEISVLKSTSSSRPETQNSLSDKIEAISNKALETLKVCKYVLIVF